MAMDMDNPEFSDLNARDVPSDPDFESAPETDVGTGFGTVSEAVSEDESNSEPELDPGFDMEAESEQEVEPQRASSSRRSKQRKPASFSFMRGLQTALGAAFIVATLFTIWTPGSLISRGLEARMAEALESASGAAPIALDAGVEPGILEGFDRIGIVAGHYGSDSGSVCTNGLTEAEMNLKIATLVQKDLTDRGYEVDLLEEFDDRLMGYRGKLLVSIHLDSCEYVNDQATGFKVAAALSAQDVVASQRLTACLSDRYAKVTDLPYHAGSVTDDMTYYHAFSEIDPGTVAAIIEAGFLNRDYRIITEETDLVAEGIVAGILCYLNNEAVQPDQAP
jgi:N-acetylmuramoyl-L-alanine amidase